jgi:hypothetical protein
MKRFAWNIFNGFQYGAATGVCGIAALLFAAGFPWRGALTTVTAICCWHMARLTRRDLKAMGDV